MSEVYPPGEHVPFCMGPDGGGACTGYLALYKDWLSKIDRVEKLEAGRMGMSPLEQTVATNIKRLKDRIEALEKALRHALVELFACSVQLNARKDGSIGRAIDVCRAALDAAQMRDPSKPVMAASEKAAEVVSGWSDAKKDYASRAVPSTLAEEQDK